jgi:hypothetical protein
MRPLLNAHDTSLVDFASINAETFSLLPKKEVTSGKKFLSLVYSIVVYQLHIMKNGKKVVCGTHKGVLVAVFSFRCRRFFAKVCLVVVHGCW